MESTATLLEPQYPTKLMIHHQAYLERPEVSNSLLQRVDQSPAHAKEWLINPPEPTAAMILGTQFHEAVLLQDAFKTHYCIEPKFDKRTTAGKDGYAKWLADNPEKVALAEKDFNQILGMMESVYNHPVAAKLLSQGQSEVSYFFRDSHTGVACKIRPDHVNGCVIDLKTTENASEWAFKKTILDYKYHHQAAFYLDGIKAATGESFDRFLFIAVEKKPPYAVATYSLDQLSIERGRHLYQRNLEIWAECLTTKIYPGYPSEIRAISIPPWGFNE